jgi:hypothetical protein
VINKSTVKSEVDSEVVDNADRLMEKRRAKNNKFSKLFKQMY